MAQTMTGGCQCGRIRFEASVGGRDAYLCHCGMCRKATGGIAAALRCRPGTVKSTVHAARQRLAEVLR